MNQHRSGATLVFIFVMLLVDVVLALVASSSRGMPSGMEVMFAGSIAGLVCGQSVFAFVWSGLVGNSWLRSYFQAVGIAALAIFLVIMATVLGSNFGPTNWTRPLCSLLTIPLFGIIGSIPLWATRYLFGWRLVWPNSLSTEKTKAVGVEDILLLTATVAGALMLTRAAIVIMMSGIDFADSAWQTTMITAVIVGAISTPFSLGSAWIFFKSESSQASFLKMSGFGLATWIVSIATVAILAPGGGVGDAVAFLMFLVLAGFGTLIFGLSCLTSDGIKLHRRWKKPVHTASTVTASESSAEPIDSFPQSNSLLAALPPGAMQPNAVALDAEENVATASTALVKNSTTDAASDPFAADDSIEIAQDAIRATVKNPHLDRMLVGALVATAVFFTAIAHREETRVQELVQAREESLNSLRNQATEVVVENGEDVEHFRGKQTLDDSIAAELDRYPGLKVVDLTGCKNITDRGATQIAKLPSLDRLILTGTSVSDNLFESINPGEFSLRELDLSNTKVTVAGIKKMFGIIRCQKLSLRGLNLSDADIKQLESLQCDEWDLRDNPISVVPARAKTLALGKSSIVVTQLSDLASDLRVLKIDGMKLADDEFIALLEQLPSLRYLSLTDTGLTDKTLDHIAKIDTLETLEIGPGNFTGSTVFPTNFSLSTLRISHPSLSLGILNALGPQIRMIDLSDSGVTDADIASIQNLMYVSYRFDRTKVTIKGIKHLMKLNAREISIRGTGITPSDVEQLAAGTFFTRLIVDENVFTDQVKNKLQRGLPIQFEDNLMFEFDDGY